MENLNAFHSTQEAKVLKRVGDESYFFQRPGSKPVILRVEGLPQTHAARKIAKKAQKMFLEGQQSGSFEKWGKTWVISSESQNGYIKQVKDLFMQTHEDSHAEHWVIRESRSSALLARLKSNSLFEEKIAPTSQEVDKGLLSWKDSPFADCFTKAASLAFQTFEPAYRNRDFTAPEACSSRLLLEGDKLLLLPKEDGRLTEKAGRETVLRYREFLIALYGRKKTELIEKRYGIDLSQLNALTPEHVYRMNIGVNDMETHDLKELLERLVQLKEGLSGKRGLLEGFFDEDQLLTGREKRALFNLLFSRFERLPTCGDLLEWIREIRPERGLANLDLRSFNSLMQIYSLSDEEAKRSLTGREIHSFIQSSYTMAEKKEYKPWVDQQEFFQTKQSLLGKSDEEFCLEKYVHVLVKKHLARLGPDGQLRTGALIPAPLDSEGRQRWYRVSGCVSNGFGNHSYTLESVCDDPSLDKIKLYRSTAHNVYAVDSAGTVYNDLNTIRSPGYEGMGLGDPYEKAFFESATLPLWTAYAELAEKKLEEGGSLEEISSALDSAYLSFEDYLLKKLHPLGLQEIIKRHDGLLNRLYRERKWGHLKAKLHRRKKEKFSVYAELLTYLKSPEQKNEAELAAKLKANLELFLSDEEKSSSRHLIKGLLLDLEKNFSEKATSPLPPEKLYADFRLEKADRASRERLREKTQKYLDWAKKLGEDSASKEKRNLLFAGHSLGGALAQAHLVHFLAKEGRVPLPGQKCRGYFVDDPAIEAEDNELFLSWGGRHAPLFSELGIGFELMRRQEAGDFVPTGGAVHLGATKGPEEEAKLSGWLSFDGRVREKLPDCLCKEIAESKIAHGTQFNAGVPGRDYRESRFTPSEQWILDQKGKVERERYLEMKEKIWKLPSGTTSYDGNRVRSWRHIQLLLRAFMGAPGAGWKAFSDCNGVTAISEEGVISRQGAACR